MKIFVPGRICLFGEHSDWAGAYRRIDKTIEKGYTLIAGTNQGIYAEVSSHPTELVITSLMPDGETVGPRTIPMDKRSLFEEAQEGGFFSYIAGVAYQIMTHYHVRGLRIDNYRTDLPVKKGLSSSAAISVLAARAFNRIYDLKMTVRGEMEMAYQGEILTPSRCGRMDQGCAFGDRPVLMTFDGEHLDCTELRVKQDLFFVIVDLCAQKDTMEILARLNRSYPVAETAVEKGVQRYLGEINKRIVDQARQALVAGDAPRIGELMREAQKLFDRYLGPACPSQLTAEVLHKVLAYPPIQECVWGGKGVGSQGDGTAQFVARDQASQEKIVEIIERDLKMPCLKLCQRAGSRVRKALIPAAGFGTRLFPASKATKKELFPIIDRDGIAKPAILLIVEEALNAGIEEVCIVVQSCDLAAFESFFSVQVSIENYNKLPRHFQEYSKHLLEVGRRVTFLTQDAQEGFGHAVYCARDWVGDEPFLLMLGDHLYGSDTETPCARQLIEAHEQRGASVLGLMKTPESDIANFGVVGGIWEEPGRLLSVSEFAEKPNAEYARTNLRVEMLEEGEYLTVFGQYVVKPQLFDYLEEHIVNNVRERGEFQLTSCLDRLRQEDGFFGYVVQGRRYDIGFPDSYLETLNAFRRA
ncbi:MAG: sugar phosphate nucleotidyltransferase [Candidatus Latescibacterota bacterium]